MATPISSNMQKAMGPMVTAWRARPILRSCSRIALIRRVSTSSTARSTIRKMTRSSISTSRNCRRSFDFPRPSPPAGGAARLASLLARRSGVGKPHRCRPTPRPLPPSGRGEIRKMKLKDVYPLYLNNKAVQPNTDLAVTDKFSGEVAFRTALATPEVIDEAIAGAVRAAEPMARLASFEKQDVLNHCVARFRERFDELAYALCVEAGKPIADAAGEVTRLIDTFRTAAEDAVRNYPQAHPLAPPAPAQRSLEHR